ncbi:MAG: DUF4079 domain-containing protein [Synechococcales bacterium]|nr:DUF4079 domain-containing protein [Synechococcales bacterium]
MDLDLKDYLRLLHPSLAILIVFPLLGLVVSRAILVRQRRLQEGKERSKIPANVGQEHLRYGQWLALSVIGVYLIGCTRPAIDNIVKKQLWQTMPYQVMLASFTYGVTLAALWALFKAGKPLWRAIFASLTGLGLVLIGLQDGIYRRDHEWIISHLYYGIVATLLMVFSLAIVPEIYRDRTNRWRMIHTIVNIVATVFFILQGITGARDLLEIPLSWQESTVFGCNFNKNSPDYKTCPKPAPKVTP